MVRVGIIGLGFMGRMHVAAYLKIAGASIVAVSDADPKRAAGDLGGGWGNVAGAATSIPGKFRGTTDWRELLAWPEVDMVDICVPTPQHMEIALAALAAGKHVLCEKPLALDSAGARAIADAAAGAKGLFMPAMCMRFWPQWAWLKAAVADGRHGRVLAATFRRVASMPPGWFAQGAMSGGAILDLHIHDTDFIYHLFGSPRAVYSRGYSKTSGGIDHLVTHYLYDDVPLVSAEGSWCMADSFNFSMRYTVNFERATADYDIGRDKPLLVHAGGKAEAIDLPGDGYEAELRYFIDCVARGVRPDMVTAADAVASIAIVEAERRSVESRQIVVI
jgi:predicted dehydrogenase